MCVWGVELNIYLCLCMFVREGVHLFWWVPGAFLEVAQ